MIAVRPSPGKGRGVFATQRIPAGTVVEEAPVIPMPASEITYLERIALQDYYFLWGPNQEDAAIALGVCTLCNHAEDPTCDFIRRLEAKTIAFVARRDITPGEEITINYNGHASADRPLWFDVLP